MLEIRWHGRGGQGAFTAAKILGASVSLHEDKYALAFPSFGPERRGAPIQAFTKIDHQKIINRSEIKKCDYIIFLDETLFNLSVLDDLKENGKVILNSSHAQKYAGYANILTIDANTLATEVLKRTITNTAMLGALAGASDFVEINSLLSGAGHYFQGSLLEKNKEVIMRAYKAAREGLQ